MMEESRTSRQYDRWSKVYDQTFGPMLARRLHRAIGELRLRPGERVLDLGIGTGVTLEHYPMDVRVVGVDLSGGMLSRALRKVHRRGMGHVKLVQGDALRPPFAERSFDHVLVSHVLSVVSDPVGLLRWAGRLIRPGGRLVLVNHFHSQRRTVAAVEKALNPLCQKLGWRTDLTLADVLRRCPLKLEYQFKLAPLDVWQIVVLSAAGAGSSETAPAAQELAVADPAPAIKAP